MAYDRYQARSGLGVQSYNQLTRLSVSYQRSFIIRAVLMFWSTYHLADSSTKLPFKPILDLWSYRTDHNAMSYMVDHHIQHTPQNECLIKQTPLLWSMVANKKQLFQTSSTNTMAVKGEHLNNPFLSTLDLSSPLFHPHSTLYTVENR